jgi:hypothetical protein
MRTVRAVLLDPATLKIKKIVDWQIQGEGQFIWHAAPGQVLVHLGHHLRLLDANLNVLREASVPGQLVFVSASPSGGYVAVGTLHERHTPTMHQQLSEDLHIEPEEDIDVQLFDQNFSVLLTTRQNSSLPPPTLSDDGEIRVNAPSPTSTPSAIQTSPPRYPTLSSSSAAPSLLFRTGIASFVSTAIPSSMAAAPPKRSSNPPAAAIRTTSPSASSAPTSPKHAAHTFVSRI